MDQDNICLETMKNRLQKLQLGVTLSVHWTPFKLIVLTLLSYKIWTFQCVFITMAFICTALYDDDGTIQLIYLCMI